jgi:hypothetical protein
MKLRGFVSWLAGDDPKALHAVVTTFRGTGKDEGRDIVRRIEESISRLQSMHDRVALEAEKARVQAEELSLRKEDCEKKNLKKVELEKVVEDLDKIENVEDLLAALSFSIIENLMTACQEAFGERKHVGQARQALLNQQIQSSGKYQQQRTVQQELLRKGILGPEVGIEEFRRISI